jgi:exonuclease III
MAFRKKAGFILVHKPDILIIPECENIERLKFAQDILQPTDILWYGTNQNKGLGVFSYSDYRFELLDCHNPDFKNVLPIAVTKGKVNFILFAVWANNPQDKDGQYVTQVWKAINYYENLLSGTKTILIGDFNSNTIWDRKYRAGNHSNVVKRLEEKGIVSCYHLHHKQIQGREQHPTFYLYKHKEKAYHLDYCFASTYFIKKLVNVEIGTYNDWTALSDHKPLIVTFDL